VLSEIPVAFVAGLVSFFAPCVLPLVPGYLSAVSAVEATRLGEPGLARKIVVRSVPFVAGFGLVFVALGVGAQLLADSLLRDQFLIKDIAGFILIVLGLAFIGLIPWPERLLGAGLVQRARSGGSRVALGCAFAVCAAPCVGPVLTGILLLAGDADTAVEGAVLLAVYSLGLAVPFVLAGAMFTRVMGAFRWVRNHFTALQVAGGVVMIAVGLLMFFDRDYLIKVYLSRFLESLGLGGV